MKKLIQHPYYIHPELVDPSNDTNRTKIAHDIGLVKLEHKFTKQLNDGIHYLINTVCLPIEGQMNKYQETTTFTGFGITNPYGSYRSETLQIGETQLAPSNSCEIEYMLCANHNPDDIKGCPVSLNLFVNL